PSGAVCQRRTRGVATRSKPIAASSLRLAFRSGRFATMARSTTSCCSTRSRKRRRGVALSIRRQIICVRSSPTDDGDLEAIMRGEVMKIVVIGGTGLIGSKVVEKLRQKGHEAIAAAPNTGVNNITG